MSICSSFGLLCSMLPVFGAKIHLFAWTDKLSQDKDLPSCFFSVLPWPVRFFPLLYPLASTLGMRTPVRWAGIHQYAGLDDSGTLLSVRWYTAQCTEVRCPAYSGHPARRTAYWIGRHHCWKRNSVILPPVLIYAFSPICCKRMKKNGTNVMEYQKYQ